MGVVNADLQYNQQQITAVGKMASSRVPVTLRDFFFDDAFFKSTWDDFEKVRENVQRIQRYVEEVRGGVQQDGELHGIQYAAKFFPANAGVKLQLQQKITRN